jgi:hypothetical protein
MSVWDKGQCGTPAGRTIRRGCTFFVPAAKCQARVLECQALKAKAVEGEGWRVEGNELLCRLWEILASTLDPRPLTRWRR